MFGLKSAVLGGTKRMMETTGAYDGGAVGMMTGMTQDTKVATNIGWRSVGSIAVGDQVLTFDGGLQVVKSVVRTPLWTGESQLPQRFWPLEVPAGALGNSEVMHLLPRQGVVVESDAAEACFGDPFALIPAAALEGLRGIARVPLRDMGRNLGDVITLQFEEDAVVFAKSGALFFCNAAGDFVADLFDAPRSSAYDMLSLGDAKALTNMIADEIAAADSDDFMPFAKAA